MKKPSPQTEIRNLKRELKYREKDRTELNNALGEIRSLQRMVEIQGDEINSWKERFDSLLGLKGEK